jgi:hypothetical protein
MLLALAAGLGAATACEKTGENQYEVSRPTVETGTTRDTINTPDVDVGTEKKTVEVPDVDVKTGDEKKD